MDSAGPLPRAKPVPSVPLRHPNILVIFAGFGHGENSLAAQSLPGV